MKNTEPAFPVKDQSNQVWSGMTLRDYFAAKAMQAMISTYGVAAPFEAMPDSANTVSDASYKFADAMLAERSKSE